MASAALFAGGTQSRAAMHDEDILETMYQESLDFNLQRAADIDTVQARLEEVDSLTADLYREMQLPTVEQCIPLKSNPTFEDSVYMERLADIRSVIDMPYNSVVRSYIDKYCVRMRRHMSVMLGMMNHFVASFETALESEQVPAELKYLPIIESALNAQATSPVGAAGLWQFMSATGRHLGLEINSVVDERRDLEKSSYAAASYLKKLYGIYNDWSLAIAAYNCGPGGVNKAIKRAGGGKDFWAVYDYLPRETRGYVPAFIAVNYVMNYYCDHGICPLNSGLPDASDTVMVSRKLYFNQIASATGVSQEVLRKLNPQYRANYIPGSRSNPCSLRLPEESIKRFIDKLEPRRNKQSATPATPTPAAEPTPAATTDTPSLPRVADDLSTPREGNTPKPLEVMDNEERKEKP